MLHRLRRRGLQALRVVPAPVLEHVVRLSAPSYALGGVCRIEHDGNVLLVRAAYRSDWGMPGGLLHRHESPADGVRREVREEVGIDVELVGDPIVVIDTYNRLVDFLFRGVLAPGASPDQAHAASSEILHVRWCRSEEVGGVVGGPARMGLKLASYDHLASGGLVVLDPSPGRRRRRRG